MNSRPLAGVRRTADILFTGTRVAVFIDGCFWHGCPQHYKPSKTNIAFWSEKIQANRDRDTETNRILSANGWLPVRIWAHVPVSEAVELIEAVLDERQRGSRR